MTSSRTRSCHPACEPLDDRCLPAAVVHGLAHHHHHAATQPGRGATHLVVIHQNHHARVVRVVQPVVFVPHHRFVGGFGPAFFYPDGFFFGGTFYAPGYYAPGFSDGGCGCSGSSFDPGFSSGFDGGFFGGFDGGFSGGFDGGGFDGGGFDGGGF